MKKFNLANKVALITGAGGGLGRSTALSLAECGASVMVSDINFSNATKISNEIKELGGNSEAIQTDISNETEAKNMVDSTIDRFGKIDILINCAGISKNMPLIETTEEDWERIYNVNVKGVFLSIRAVLPHMIKQQSGKIVNFSSMVGKEAVPNNVAYSSSKFAVMGITQGVAKEVGKYNINVNAVCPGVIMTDLMDKEATRIAKLEGIMKEEVIQKFREESPLNRLQTPEDVAGVVAFLCSDMANNMTGQGINITGGMMLH